MEDKKPPKRERREVKVEVKVEVSTTKYDEKKKLHRRESAPPASTQTTKVQMKVDVKGPSKRRRNSSEPSQSRGQSSKPKSSFRYNPFKDGTVAGYIPRNGKHRHSHQFDREVSYNSYFDGADPLEDFPEWARDKYFD